MSREEYLERVRKGPPIDEVLIDIKNRMISGQINIGDVISTGKITDRYGMSRNQAGMVVTRLTAAGIVTRQAANRFQVAHIPVNPIQDEQVTLLHAMPVSPFENGNEWQRRVRKLGGLPEEHFEKLDSASRKKPALELDLFKQLNGKDLVGFRRTRTVDGKPFDVTDTLARKAVVDALGFGSTIPWQTDLYGDIDVTNYGSRIPKPDEVSFFDMNRGLRLNTALTGRFVEREKTPIAVVSFRIPEDRGHLQSIQRIPKRTG